MTGVAQEMRVQGEALRARLIGELLTTLLREEKKKRDKAPGMLIEEGRSATKALHDKGLSTITSGFLRYLKKSRDKIRIAHLTVVALKVIVLVHRHNPEDLFTALRHKMETSD